jgi:hypothetical protein
LNKHSILAEGWFGFRTSFTTNKTIYNLINEVLNALNNKFVIGVFFYFEKAFDCLNHNILLSKLQFYGVNGKAKLWLESYLNNRYKRVQISDEELNQTSLSTCEKITDGVSQGSVLSPMLFLICINPLPKTVNE